ncbi:MAG: hypothetical protein ACLQBX_01105 [Candidatus Limnocylindrales bacterium]
MELPDIGRYRRRFVVEFGPEDSGLIDRMGLAHRTKRAAIVAGLRLLESGELEQLRAQVAGLQAELATAQHAPAAAQRATGAAGPKLDKAKADLAAERAAHRRTQKTLDQAQAALSEAQVSLARAQQEIVGLRAERDRVADLLPHHAYCRYCEKLVPEGEWAEHPTPEGVDVYHGSDGYRARGSLRGPATILFQRRGSGQAAR